MVRYVKYVCESTKYITKREDLDILDSDLTLTNYYGKVLCAKLASLTVDCEMNPHFYLRYPYLQYRNIRTASPGYPVHKVPGPGTVNITS